MSLRRARRPWTAGWAGPAPKGSAPRRWARTESPSPTIPNVVTIASVAGGDTSEFSSTPTSNTGVPGTTNVSSFQSSSLMAPTGLVSVAKVTVDAVAAASTSASIGLTVRYLFDTNSKLILPSTEMGCTVAVTTPTTTSTSTSTTTTSTSTTTTTTQPPTTTTTRPPTTTTTTTTTTSTTPRPTTTSTTTTTTT